MKKAILLYTTLICLIFGCKKDDDGFGDNKNKENEEEVIQNFEENFGDQIQADFIGKILNQDKEPIAEVQVSIGSFTTQTDENGIFSFKKARVFEAFAYIKAFKEGYINGSRMLLPIPDETNFLTIILLEKEVISVVNSDEEADIELTNGVKVNLKGKYITESGQDYNGKVEVSLHYLAPSNLDTYSEMPGSLLGSLENNKAVLLESYGMVAVNLFSPLGAPLNIHPDSPATIEMPVDPSQIAFAPETIPLWYFDDDLGYWIKEGNAVKENGKYIGQVSHFSFWNCDDFNDSVSLCVKVNNSQNKPVANTKIILEREIGEFITSSGITNNLGTVCGLIPSDEIITLKVYFTDCDEKRVSYKKQIGPFSVDASIDISLNIAEFEYINITASAIKCDDTQPVTNGYAFFQNGNKSSAIPIIDNVVKFDYLYCINKLNASVVFYDLDNQTKSEITEFTFVGDEMNLGEINICENSSSNEDDNIFNGNVEFKTQEEVESFGNNGYTKITGDLIISDDSPAITNLGALEKLVVVQGDLEIKFNADLSNLFGLQNLQRVEGSLLIRGNSELNDITGLQSLSVIGGNLAFVQNHKAINLDGLQKITTINNDLDIVANDGLESLEGLNNLEQVLRNFSLGSGFNHASLTSENKSLNNINALQKLSNVGLNFRLIGQPILLDYTGLNNLITVGNDFSISFEGEQDVAADDFDNLESVGSNLHIYAENITGISGFNNLQNAKIVDINGSGSPVKSISGFKGLVGGSVDITLMTNLESIEGFESLVNADDVSVSRNPVLKSITGFNSLETISGVFGVSSNPLLEDASGFSLLREVGVFFTLSDNDSMTNLNDFVNFSILKETGGVYITQMDGLIDLTGLSGLISVEKGRLEITNNSNLTSLKGIDNLEVIGGYFLIDNCDKLINLDGLQGLKSIGEHTKNFGTGPRANAYLEIINNDNLVSLDGLDNLISVGRDVRIGTSWNISSIVRRANPKLSDFCALKTLVENDNSSAVFEIENNAFNPTRYNILQGNCKP